MTFEISLRAGETFCLFPWFEKQKANKCMMEKILNATQTKEFCGECGGYSLKQGIYPFYTPTYSNCATFFCKTCFEGWLHKLKPVAK